MPNAMADVAGIVITYNEEVNIARAPESVAGWAREVFVAFIFPFMQALWFPLLIDAKYLEMKWNKEERRD